MRPLFWFLLFLLTAWSCSDTSHSSQSLDLFSPNQQLRLTFQLSEQGTPYYRLFFKEQLVLDSSSLGFSFVDQTPLKSQLKLIGTTATESNTTYTLPWGEQRTVLDHHRELRIDLQEQTAPNRRFSILFRLFNDGLGFRYLFPKQEGWANALIQDEHTEFNLPGNPTCWWIPGDWDSYEHLYTTSNLRSIDATKKRNHPNLIASFIPENAVNTPITLKTKEGFHLSIHEAALTDYASMTLRVDTINGTFTSSLVGSENNPYKVLRMLPFETPWRTVLITETAAELISSNLLLHLNPPPPADQDFSWVKPTKYVGIWWELHLDKSTWAYETNRHGATTENAKKYIDFAVNNNIRAVLVEGWNTGWLRWIGFPDREGIFDFTTAYPDYDLAEVARYAKEKEIELIMHHETSAAPRTYDQRMDAAYQLMKKLDIDMVKTGYVGPIIPKGEYHHGQWMVNHYRRVVQKAADYKIAVNVHEPIKDTGIRRTYPNMLTREGLRGQAYNNLSVEGGNPPEHLPIVAFTRMLAGPIDYPPGIFQLLLAPYRPESQINTTLAHQLALYVVLYSPMQMAADLPENYEGHPAFQFIRDVGVDWEQTLVLNGEVGDFVTIAREERKTGDWFLGSITDEHARTFTLPLDFLENGKSYIATIYADDKDSHWNENPMAYRIEQRLVDHTSSLELALAPGGGIAISFKLAD